MMHDAEIVLNAVVNDCREYWNAYYKTGITVSAVLIFLYCISLLYRFIRFRNSTKDSLFNACMKIPFIALLGLYCYLVLGITVLSRNKETAYILRLAPFSTWGADPWSLTLWIENILMMVPFGVLLYILWRPFRRIGWSLLAGGLFSLSIESTQLIARLGKFETDDIMNNVFGVLAGFLFCKIINKVFDQ